MNDNWYSEDAATFGDRVAAAREASGMTQAQLARRMGIKLGTLQSWEQDLNEPRANKLQMMAGLLNVSLMWLLNGEGDGLDGPPEEEDIAPEVSELLGELRDLRTQIKSSGDKLARLEKRLRAALKES
jgi:transcriptional regulator with XRE-family HTH domain